MYQKRAWWQKALSIRKITSTTKNSITKTQPNCDWEVKRYERNLQTKDQWASSPWKQRTLLERDQQLHYTVLEKNKQQEYKKTNPHKGVGVMLEMLMTEVLKAF